jgi:hypothetical protein
MGLKIIELNASSATGVLDGMLPVRAIDEGDAVRISIAGWMRQVPKNMIDDVSAMRYALYWALARYREDISRLDRGTGAA